MSTEHIMPMDEAAKRRLIKAVADRGKASGLAAAAKVLEHLAATHTRVVGTNTIRDAAVVLQENAAALHKAAAAEIAELQQRAR